MLKSTREMVINFVLLSGLDICKATGLILHIQFVCVGEKNLTAHRGLIFKISYPPLDLSYTYIYDINLVFIRLTMLMQDCNYYNHIN